MYGDLCLSSRDFVTVNTNNDAVVLPNATLSNTDIEVYQKRPAQYQWQSMSQFYSCCYRKGEHFHRRACAKKTPIIIPAPYNKWLSSSTSIAAYTFYVDHSLTISCNFMGANVYQPSPRLQTTILHLSV